MKETIRHHQCGRRKNCGIGGAVHHVECRLVFHSFDHFSSDKKGREFYCGVRISRVITRAMIYSAHNSGFLGERLPLVAVMRHKSRWNLIISCGLFIKTRCRHIQLRDNIVVQRCRNVTFRSRTCYRVLFFLHFKLTLNVFLENGPICFIWPDEAHGWWAEASRRARSLSKRKQTKLGVLKLNLRLQIKRILMKLYINRFVFKREIEWWSTRWYLLLIYFVKFEKLQSSSQNDAILNFKVKLRHSNKVLSN